MNEFKITVIRFSRIIGNSDIRGKIGIITVTRVRLMIRRERGGGRGVNYSGAWTSSPTYRETH